MPRTTINVTYTEIKVIYKALLIARNDPHMPRTYKRKADLLAGKLREPGSTAYQSK